MPRRSSRRRISRWTAKSIPRPKTVTPKNVSMMVSPFVSRVTAPRVATTATTSGTTTTKIPTRRRSISQNSVSTMTRLSGVSRETIPNVRGLVLGGDRREAREADRDRRQTASEGFVDQLLDLEEVPTANGDLERVARHAHLDQPRFPRSRPRPGRLAVSRLALLLESLASVRVGGVVDQADQRVEDVGRHEPGRLLQPPLLANRW